MALYDSGVLFDGVAAYDQQTVTTRRDRMKTKPALGLGFLNGAQIVQLTTNIIAALTGNANFTTPSPTLVELGAARDLASDKIDAYEVAADAAATALSNRDLALEDVRVKLTSLASYVDGIAQGSENIIPSAGMPIRSTPAPVAMTQEIGRAHV